MVLRVNIVLFKYLLLLLLPFVDKAGAPSTFLTSPTLVRGGTCKAGGFLASPAVTAVLVRQTAVKLHAVVTVTL